MMKFHSKASSYGAIPTAEGETADSTRASLRQSSSVKALVQAHQNPEEMDPMAFMMQALGLRSPDAKSSDGGDDDDVLLPFYIRYYLLFVGALSFPFALVIAILTTPFSWLLSGFRRNFFSLFKIRLLLAIVQVGAAISLVFIIAGGLLYAVYRLLSCIIMIPINMLISCFACCLIPVAVIKVMDDLEAADGEDKAAGGGATTGADAA